MAAYLLISKSMKFLINKIFYFKKYKRERKRLILKLLTIIFLEIFFILASLILLPFFLFLKKIIDIRFYEITSNRIGHLLLNTELYLCKKQKNYNKKYSFDIFYFSEKISNKYISKHVKKNLKVLPRFFFSRFHKILELLKIDNIQVREINESYDKDNLLFEYKPFIQILDYEVENGWYQLEKNFQTPRELFENKIAFFSIRDSAYLDHEFPENKWNYHNYRDVDSDNFLLAAETLANKGYKVFRLGRKVAKPFKSKNSNVIDYANSNFKSDFLDLFIGKVSKFGVSTGTGIENVATAFRKPLCIIHVPFEKSYFHCGNLIMTRNHYSKSLKRNLTISEIFENGSKMKFKYSSELYENQGINLQENTKEEINDFVIERLNSLEQKNIDFFNTEHQREFWKVFNHNLNKYNIRYYNKINGYFSNIFLEKNEWFIK